jgi:hypothetical protein
LESSHRSGKFSPSGAHLVDPSELHRVYSGTVANTPADCRKL